MESWAEKYRPNTLSEIIGNTKTISQLQNWAGSWGEKMTKKGTYKVLARMRSRAEPLYFMKFVGATQDMERSINEWMLDIHPYAVEFEVK